MNKLLRILKRAEIAMQAMQRNRKNIETILKCLGEF